METSNLLSEIQSTLSCTTERANDVLSSLNETKMTFDLDSSIESIWEQEKEYFIKYGYSAFDAGYLGLINNN